MKRIIFPILCLLLTLSVSSQSTIAKLKYEQAEEAFTKNDFQTTLLKLEEAQKLLGKVNPKLLYLRIMAQKGIVSNGQFDYAELESARKNVQYYLKNYENNEGVEDKYRDVFLFSETLEKYPASKVAWDQQKAQESARLKQLENEKVAKKAAADKYIESYNNSFKWKPGLTKNEFKKYNPKAVRNSSSYATGPYEFTIGKDDYVTAYTHIVSSECYSPKQLEKREVVQRKFAAIKNEVLSYFNSSELIEHTNNSIIMSTHSTTPKKFIAFRYHEAATIRNFRCAYITMTFY